ncbi:BgTH12-01152 [Blumeria graminis f. sp. triticale]|uniref:BgTH12-01152 n=1 Tax=Blumeria graminis f. sp. triticale TaxID=1689686 RepID=A0A9W4D8B2_BLUGR|nr:BgTH12-01152 [Blumeria graminis f. sp. triticale]
MLTHIRLPRHLSQTFTSVAIRAYQSSIATKSTKFQTGESPGRIQQYFITVNRDPNLCADFITPGPFGLRETNTANSDTRTLKLGKTLRILQERLPTLLQKPLPPEILSPQITLHLFPSTHPHLPTVTGRVAYSAALWTSPIAWGRLPLISNVKLQIISERMIRQASTSTTPAERKEQLVVRWCTVGKPQEQGIGALYHGINTIKSTEFTGLFIFDFDEEGRILVHTIEHAQEGGNWERGVGAKVVALTDWLLGGMKGDGHGEGAPCPVFWSEDLGKTTERKLK